MEIIEYGKEFDRDKLKDVIKSSSREDIMESCIHNLIVCIGGDPDRAGLKETPKRVRKMYDEIFEGMKYTNEQIAEKCNKCFEADSNDLVVVSNIPIFSTCEHHIATMYSMHVSVGYIPKGRIIGLSKVARIADLVSKRLQLQERIGAEIAEIMQIIVGTDDIIVAIEGEHSCMTMRGIKKPGSITRTATIRGRFEFDSDLRSEFYSLIK